MGFRMANIDGRAALVDGVHYYDVETTSAGGVPSDPMEALTYADELSELQATLDTSEPSGRLADVTLDAPVPRPRNCFGIGLNYAAHAAESGMELPTSPVVFTKFPSCIVGPTADVEMRSDGVDYEVELVVVIGLGGKDIAKKDVWDRIVGLTIGQDISDRPVQFSASPPQFNLGKSFDTFGPIGPYLVSPDLVADPSNLRLSTKINDEVRQDGTTSQLIFDIPALVSYISHITTLTTGDLIFTGTPDGVGVSQGKLLQHGDVITSVIQDLGTMTNRCVRVSDYATP
ncbi:MAG: fumarylacetoacetate hydrolase family protein [Acidimicrobiaceae bacterium]|nr:fumarylacetoacetate hydrolase family protein [Acidimicrobiaceae bacterium]